MQINFMVGNTPDTNLCLTFGDECVIFYETDFEFESEKKMWI